MALRTEPDEDLSFAPASTRVSEPTPIGREEALQSGWVTLGLYAVGAAVYIGLGAIKPGLINFPPLALLCLLVVGWLAPSLWRRRRP